MTHVRCRVLPPWNLHGYEAGEVLEMRNDQRAQRAIDRKSVEVLEHFTPSIQPGTFTLPLGWLTPRDADMASDHRKEQ